MKTQTVSSPRFVWSVGSYHEQFPDMPEDLGLVLWDRQERKRVVVVRDEYAQALCLETSDSKPFTAMEEWFNGLSNRALESEGIVTTAKEFAQ